MRSISRLITVVVFAISYGCGGSGGGVGPAPTPPPPPPPPSPPPACAANTICMLSSTFDPTELTVTKGTVVNFSNDLGVTHNVVFDPPVSPGMTDIGTTSGGSIPRTFGTSGTFPFHCTIHGGVGTGMHGQIVVP